MTDTATTAAAPPTVTTHIRGSVLARAFHAITAVNLTRCAQWHPADSQSWTGADWSNAMQGEAGEAGNVVKKLRRHETRTAGPLDPPVDELRVMLANEIADVWLYLDLLAAYYSIDVPSAVAAKFNAVSERQGFPHRLAVDTTPMHPTIVEVMENEDGSTGWAMGHIDPALMALSAVFVKMQNEGAAAAFELLVGRDTDYRNPDPAHRWTLADQLATAHTLTGSVRHLWLAPDPKNDDNMLTATLDDPAAQAWTTITLPW